jgi:putative methyltransferase (TIGR04325 family)
MAWRDVGREILATRLFAWALTALSRNSVGLFILTAIGQPHCTYPSFAEAAKAAGVTQHGGHSSPRAIRSHASLAGTVLPSDYPAIYWIARLASNPLRIFDYGGNVGNLYYSYRRCLPESIHQVRWTVFDLAAVVAEGTLIATENGTTEIEFQNTVQTVTGNDLVLVSGALHYWEASLAKFIEQFPEKPAAFILNRTPVHPDTNYITVQVRPFYSVPCVVRTAEEILSAFGSAGYKLADRWQVPERSMRMAMFPALTIPSYSGFCFVRNDRYKS